MKTLLEIDISDYLSWMIQQEEEQNLNRTLRNEIYLD